MKRHNSTIEHLRSISLFAGCSRSELALIASNVNEHHAAAGDVLIREGGSGREFFVIVEGTASVLVGGTAVATLGPGDFAGEVALLDHGLRTASVVAVTDLVAEVSTPREFAALLAGVAGLAQKLLVGLAQRVRTADIRLAS